MSAFFDEVVRFEYPNGADIDSIKSLSESVDKFEEKIFDELEWLENEKQEKQTSFLMCAYKLAKYSNGKYPS